MENKEFQIIPLQGRSLLVVILSSEMTNYYWKELQTELANLNIADAEVYFDFLYRNGLKNRFFKSKLKGMMLISNSLRKCEAPKEYIKVADTFFAPWCLNWIFLPDVRPDATIRMVMLH